MIRIISSPKNIKSVSKIIKKLNEASIPYFMSENLTSFEEFKFLLSLTSGMEEIIYRQSISSIQDFKLSDIYSLNNEKRLIKDTIITDGYVFYSINNLLSERYSEAQSDNVLNMNKLIQVSTSRMNMMNAHNRIPHPIPLFIRECFNSKGQLIMN